MDAETRMTQLENALRALLDALDMITYEGVWADLEQVRGAEAEARALLDGEGAPADTENP